MGIVRWALGDGQRPPSGQRPATNSQVVSLLMGYGPGESSARPQVGRCPEQAVKGEGGWNKLST